MRKSCQNTSGFCLCGVDFSSFWDNRKAVLQGHFVQGHTQFCPGLIYHSFQTFLVFLKKGSSPIFLFQIMEGKVTFVKNKGKIQQEPKNEGRCNSLLCYARRHSKCLL